MLIMAVSEIELSPIELAQCLQSDIINIGIDHRYDYVVQAFRLLQESSEELRSEGARFFIDSNSAVNCRYRRNVADNVELGMFGQVAVEGTFNDFSYVRIGRLIVDDGSGREATSSVDSLCLSLEDVRFLPDGESLSEASVLQIPVLAINQSLRAA